MSHLVPGHRRRPIPVRAWVSLAFALGVMVGGFFLPILGLAVPLILIAAVATNFWRKRWFCGNVCPRASILSHVIAPLSGYRRLPAVLYSDGARSIGCGLLMVCAVGQTMRLWPALQAVGWFFWVVCVLTFGVAVLMGLFFKPRSWCAVCPLGTLQQTLNPSKKAAE